MGELRASSVAVRLYGRLVTIEQVAERCGLHPHFVRHLTDLGLIEPTGRSGDLFPPEAISRVQKIVRLRQDLGINFNGIGVVLDLLEELEILRARLQKLEGR